MGESLVFFKEIFNQRTPFKILTCRIYVGFSAMNKKLESSFVIFSSFTKHLFFYKFKSCHHTCGFVKMPTCANSALESVRRTKREQLSFVLT